MPGGRGRFEYSIGTSVTRNSKFSALWGVNHWKYISKLVELVKIQYTDLYHFLDTTLR